MGILDFSQTGYLRIYDHRFSLFVFHIESVIFED